MSLKEDLVAFGVSKKKEEKKKSIIWGNIYEGCVYFVVHAHVIDRLCSNSSSWRLMTFLGGEGFG